MSFTKRGKGEEMDDDESMSPRPRHCKVVSYKYKIEETNRSSDPPVKASVYTNNQPINNGA